MTARVLPFPHREDSVDDTPGPDPLTAGWRDLDVVDTAAFDDNYFADLAGSIEQAIDASAVVPLRRRLLPLVAAAAAVAVIGFVSLRPDGPPSVDSLPGDGLDAELIAAARAVGKSAGATLLDEELDTNLYASLDWMDNDEELTGTYNSLLRELDEVPSSELHTLLSPL